MDGAFGLVLDNNNNKLLLVKRKDYPIWVMPGGGVNFNETSEEAVMREVFEETGFKVKIVRKIAEYLISPSRISHFFECSIVSGKPTPSKESSKVEFFDLSNLPEPTNPQIFDFLKDYILKEARIIKKPIPKITQEFMFKTVFKHPIIVVRYLLTKVGVRINT